MRVRKTLLVIIPLACALGFPSFAKPAPAGTPRPLAIGPLALTSPVLLAPMAGYTDLAFRASVRALGGLGLAFYLGDLAMRVFVDTNNDDWFDEKSYADAGADYSSSIIQPPINPADIPPEGRVISQLTVGAMQPGNGYPQGAWHGPAE